jgi:phosphatidylinositol alpha-mannosyltransferase
MAEAYVSRYVPGKYEIIPNGVDTEVFKPDVRPIEKYCDGKKNILFLGRLERRKGLIYLIKAFYLLKQQVPDSRLIVVGPGASLRSPYEKWIKNHGLKEDVVFTGYISEEDKPRYFKTADVYCSPATSRESFGIVLLEAMAVGTPVVASDIDGYNSVVTHDKDGLLTPARDTEALARTLISALKDEPLRERLSAEALKTVQKYSWESVARRVYDFYQKTLENHAAENKF